jgi:PAS domain S-box-containing protein
MNTRVSNRFNWWIIAFPRFAGAATALIGILVIVGWILTVPILMSVHPDLISMEVNTAIAFMLSGVSLLLFSTKKDGLWILSARLLAYAVLLLGLATAAEYAFGWDAGIDQLFFRETMDTGLLHPGRMVLNTTISFCLLGLSLLTIGRNTRWATKAAQILSLLVGLGGLLALLVHIYGQSDYSAYAVHTRMALHAAVSFILSALGVLCLQRTAGFTNVILGNGSGSYVARRMMLAAVAVPVALAWLVGQGEHFLYGDEFADVVTAAADMIILFSLVWFIGRSLNKADREREHGENALRDSEERYRSLIEKLADGIAIVDRDERFSLVNPAAEAMFGVPSGGLVGRSIGEFVDPKEFVNIQDQSAHRQQGEISRYGIQIMRPDGVKRELLTTASPFYDNDGTFIGALGIFHDITDRKRADEALQNEHLLLRTVIDNIPDSIYSKDLESRKTLTNAADLSHMGAASEADVLGKNDFDFYPKDLAEGFYANDQKVMRTGEPTLNKEEYILTEKGQKRWLLSSKIPLRDSEGKIIGLVGIGRDITERKQAEETIKNSLALLETIIESTNNGILVVDSGGKIVKFNGRFAEMWRIPGDILEAGEDERMLSHILNQLTIPEVFLARVKELYDEPMAESFDVLYFKDGRIFERVSRPLLVAGEPKGRAWAFRDITEQKHNADMVAQSEERYRTIVENIGEGICFLDSDERFILANGAAEEIFGVDPAGLYGKSLEQFVTEKQNTVVRGETANRQQGQTSVYELEIVRPTGEKRNIIITAVPQNDNISGFLGTLGVFRDITEQKNMEQDLRSAQKMESLGIVAGGIAHDYNNLLAIMIGNISLAQHHLPADHPSGKNIEKAMTAMERAAELTKQMLAYSGKGMFEIQTCDVADLIHRQMPVIKTLLSQNVKLVTHLPSMPVCVSGDPGQIKQIIINLINNGREAIGPLPGVITVTVAEVTIGSEDALIYNRITKTTLPEGIYAMIEVRDTGSGMDEGTLDRIFDPFFTTKFIGRGLGLSAVFGIIQAHKGGILVESTLGMGTIFKVILPVIQTP